MKLPFHLFPCLPLPLYLLSLHQNLSSIASLVPSRPPPLSVTAGFFELLPSLLASTLNPLTYHLVHNFT